MKTISIIVILLIAYVHTQAQVSFDSLDYKLAIINSDRNLTGPMISEGSIYAVDSLKNIDSLGQGGFSYYIYHDKKTKRIKKYTYEHSMHYGYEKLQNPNTERVEIETYFINDSISIIRYYNKYYDNEQDFYYDSATIIVNNKKDYDSLYMSKNRRQRIKYCLEKNKEAKATLEEYLKDWDELFKK